MLGWRGGGGGGREEEGDYTYNAVLSPPERGFQARSKDQEILEEGGGAGPSLLPRRDHE